MRLGPSKYYITMYHQEDPPLPTLFHNLKGGSFHEHWKLNEIKSSWNLSNSETFRWNDKSRTHQHSMSYLRHPWLGRCGEGHMSISKRYWTEAKTPPKTAAPKEKSRSWSIEAEVKEEKNWIFSLRKTESLQVWYVFQLDLTLIILS